MKALSIRQPWAWLIVHGFKPIENREWPTNHRGPTLIHASKGMTRREYDQCEQFLTQEIDNYLDGQFSLPDPDELERGGFVGVANLLHCLVRGKPTTYGLITGEESAWFVGKHGFVMCEPKPFTFIPYKGRLGFFDINLKHLFDTKCPSAISKMEIKRLIDNGLQ
jgi:hypothetical protein